MFCFGSGAADPAQVQAAGHPRGGGAGGEPDHARHCHQPLQRVSAPRSSHQEGVLSGRVSEPGYLAGAGAVTLARLRLQLQF